MTCRLVVLPRDPPKAPKTVFVVTFFAGSGLVNRALKLSGVVLAALLVFWGCEKQQPFQPPPPPPPVPSNPPKVNPAYFQSGNLTVQFEEKDLKTCEISGSNTDAQLVVDYESAQKTYLSIRLRKFNLGAQEHRTVSPGYGWIYLKVPSSFDTAESESEYYVDYILDSNRERQSSMCITTYTINGSLLSVAFDCKRLYNSALQSRDFTGRYSCNLRTSVR